MAAIYAPPPSSRSTTPAPSAKQTLKPSSHLSPRTKRTKALRTVYSAAAKAFLVRDYSATAALLQEATTTVAVKDGERTKDDWFRALQERRRRRRAAGGGEDSAMILEQLESELRRKIDILTVTFLATVHPSHSAASPPLFPLPISALLLLPPPTLLTTLWHSSLISPSSGDILPTSHAAFLHPSIAIALSLAALKLNEQRTARAVAEAWFGSIDTEVDQFLAEEMGRIQAQDEGEEDVLALFPVDGGLGLAASMNWGRKDLHGALNAEDTAGKTLLGCWFRLWDLLVLHVLPGLGEWEAARDFVEVQGAEAGGWVPEARIEATLQQLELLQRRETELHDLRLQKLKELDLAKVAKQKEKEREHKASKGKSTASPESKSPKKSSTSATAAKPNQSPPVLPHSISTSSSIKAPLSNITKPPSSFASLRSSISSYLSSSTPTTAAAAPTTTSTTSIRSGPSSLFSSLIPRVIRNQLRSDPVRLLSTIFLAVAVISWVRRTLLNKQGRNQQAGGGLMKVLGKVLETVKMGTKVTTL